MTAIKSVHIILGDGRKIPFPKSILEPFLIKEIENESSIFEMIEEDKE